MIDFNLLAQELGPEPGAEKPEMAVAVPDDNVPDDLWHGDTIAVKPLPPILDACDFVVTKYEPSPELIKGLVHQGTKVVIGGGSKSFKTWVQLDAAISVAYGLTWMDCETQAGRVLFVNLEIKPEFFQSRVAKICEARGIQQCPGRLDIWNLRGYSAPYRVIIPKIIERVMEAKYSLIVLDPVYKLYGNTDENSASEVAQLLNELERVCVETGAAVMFGAHYSKGNQAAKESIDRISGSGVFARDPDTIIPFTKHEEEGSFVVEPILRNLPPVTPFVVSWNHPLMERNQDLDASKLKQSGGRPKEHVPKDILSLLDDGRLTNEKWQEMAAKNYGISRATFFRLKSELKSQGVIMFSRIDDTWVKVEKQ
jgi:hypothetical protein